MIRTLKRKRRLEEREPVRRAGREKAVMAFHARLLAAATITPAMRNHGVLLVGALIVLPVLPLAPASRYGAAGVASSATPRLCYAAWAGPCFPHLVMALPTVAVRMRPPRPPRYAEICGDFRAIS